MHVPVLFLLWCGAAWCITNKGNAPGQQQGAEQLVHAEYQTVFTLPILRLVKTVNCALYTVHSVHMIISNLHLEQQPLKVHPIHFLREYAMFLRFSLKLSSLLEGLNEEQCNTCKMTKAPRGWGYKLFRDRLWAICPVIWLKQYYLLKKIRSNVNRLLNTF